ncbi:dynamin-related protein 4C-like protein [Tanacetum coccineum]
MNVIDEGTITLPTIVVIGDQSSGKSSVIESLTGISLPCGIRTRVPLIIRLQHHSDPSFISQLHLEYKGKSVPVNEDRILEEISLATDQIAGNGCRFVVNKYVGKMKIKLTVYTCSLY